MLIELAINTAPVSHQLCTNLRANRISHHQLTASDCQSILKSVNMSIFKPVDIEHKRLQYRKKQIQPIDKQSPIRAHSLRQDDLPSTPIHTCCRLVEQLRQLFTHSPLRTGRKRKRHLVLDVTKMSAQLVAGHEL